MRDSCQRFRKSPEAKVTGFFSIARISRQTRWQPFHLMTPTDQDCASRVNLPRTFLTRLLAGIFSLVLGQAQAPSSKAADPARQVLYAATGAELTRYDVDTEGASIVKRSSIRLPANIQYAWPHPSRKYLYVAWSDGGAATAAPGAAAVPHGKLHGVSAFRIDPALGRPPADRSARFPRVAADSSERGHFRYPCFDRL